MALENIKQEIETFIKSPTPQVLALSGAWGTGKTFIWNQKIEACPPWGPKSLALAPKRYFKYSYVSASNCTSLDTLKSEILSLTVQSQNAGGTPSAWQTFWRNGKATVTLGTIAGLLLTVLTLYLLPSGANKESFIGKFLFGGALSSFFAVLCQFGFNFWQQTSLDLALKDSIICIDDIERAEAINPHDILHYAAWLRDQRRCKVMLLLNADRLTKQKNNKNVGFQDALEKGANQFLRLNLTAQEAGKIWKKMIKEKKLDFPENWIKPFLEITTEVRISNIRVLDHLATALKRWHPILEKYESSNSYEDLQKHIFLGTVITGCGFYQPRNYPTLKQIQNRLEEEKDQYFEKLFSTSLQEQNSEVTKFEDIIEENFILIKKLSSKLSTPPSTFSDDNYPFWKKCFENIKNGYPSAKTHVAITNFLDNEQNKSFYMLIRQPRALFSGKLSQNASLSDIRQTLKKISGISEKKYKKISLEDIADILIVAQKIKEIYWANNFLEKYLKALKHFPKSYFQPYSGKQDSRQWIKNRHPRLWSEFINIMEEKNLSDRKDKFISELSQNDWCGNIPIISETSWEKILFSKTKMCEEMRNILQQMFRHVNSPEIPEKTLNNFVNAIQSICKDKTDEAILFQARYDYILEENKNFLKLHKINLLEKKLT